MKKNIINQRDKNGKRHGLWEEYYSNGIISSKGEYKNGRQHGPWERYHSNGQLSFKGEFKKGKSIGIWYEQRYNF